MVHLKCSFDEHWQFDVSSAVLSCFINVSQNCLATSYVILLSSVSLAVQSFSRTALVCKMSSAESYSNISCFRASSSPLTWLKISLDLVSTHGEQCSIFSDQWNRWWNVWFVFTRSSNSQDRLHSSYKIQWLSKSQFTAVVLFPYF